MTRYLKPLINRKFAAGIILAVFIIAITITGLFLFKNPENDNLPKAAIVIDDWGYNINNIALLDSIDAPITLAILPNLKFSGRIAFLENRNLDREIILHMPMEPENDSLRLEKDTLLCSMDEEKIEGLFGKALKTVPFAKGVSNHMGSRATRDPKVINALMKSLKSNKLFFLDSMAVSETVCRQSAKDCGVAFVKRDVFLDNIADKGYISSQLDELIAAALKQGSAVGIGHDRALTLEAIRDKLPEFKDSRVKLVLLSELAKRD